MVALVVDLCCLMLPIYGSRSIESNCDANLIHKKIRESADMEAIQEITHKSGIGENKVFSKSQIRIDM